MTACGKFEKINLFRQYLPTAVLLRKFCCNRVVGGNHNGDWCFELIFRRVVQDVGKIAAGRYKIVAEGGPNMLGMLPIQLAEFCVAAVGA